MREIPKYLLSVILLVLFGCSESDNMQDDASPTGEVSFLTLSAVCSTYDLEIDVDEDWQIEYEAGWIFISQDEMSGVGRKTIQFYVEQNSREEERQSDVVVKSGNQIVHRWRITQQVSNAGSDNALFTSDLRQTYAVGWGYNAFGEYASVGDVRRQVINYAKLKELEKKSSDDIAIDEAQYELEYQKAVAYSMAEFSKTITQESNTKTNLLFYKKEVKKRTTNTTTTKNECSFATLSVMNIVAQRHLSQSAIQLLMSQGHDILTEDFKLGLLDLQDNTISAREFINRFGTDVVLTAWLGGRLDYTTTIKKTTTTEIEQVVTTTYKKLFKKSSTMTEEEKKFSEKVAIDYECTSHVKGGETQALEKEINEKISKKEPIDDRIFVEWESSFSDAESMLASGKATLVDFRTVPIYEFITDANLKALVEKEIKQMANDDDSNTEWEEETCFQVNLPNNIEGLLLAEQKEGNHRVMAEICSEYIPTIRTDKRVLVAYPILANGRPNHERGLFMGDGAGNAPGRVMWKDGKAYYYRDESYGNQDVIQTFYIYCDELFSKRTDYMSRHQVLQTVRMADKVNASALRMQKIGLQYWAYMPDYTYDVGAQASPNLTSFHVPTIEELNELHTSLLNDFSLLFQTDGRSGLNLPGNEVCFPLQKDAVRIYHEGVYRVITTPTSGKYHFIRLRNADYTYF